MQPKGNYRVLLMCKKCDKVYNGTKPMSYSDAMRWYHNTLVKCNDVCPKEDCEEKLVPEIQCMDAPKRRGGR